MHMNPDSPRVDVAQMKAMDTMTQAKRHPPIAKALEQIGTAIERLQLIAGTLEDRLAPVTSSVPSETPPNLGVDLVGCSSLATDMQGLWVRLCALADRLEGLRDRVEV